VSDPYAILVVTERGGPDMSFNWTSQEIEFLEELEEEVQRQSDPDWL